MEMETQGMINNPNTNAKHLTIISLFGFTHNVSPREVFVLNTLF